MAHSELNNYIECRTGADKGIESRKCERSDGLNHAPKPACPQNDRDQECDVVISKKYVLYTRCEEMPRHLESGRYSARQGNSDVFLSRANSCLPLSVFSNTEVLCRRVDILKQAQTIAKRAAGRGERCPGRCASVPARSLVWFASNIDPKEPRRGCARS